MDFADIKKKLENYNQTHLLKFYDNLSDEQKQSLLDDIEKIDFEILKNLNNNEEQADYSLSPMEVMTIPKIKENTANYFSQGISAIKEGKIAAVLLAGGQGSRLGFDGPKGTLNVGINKELYIFELLINNILDVLKQADNTWIYLYIMTSVKNNSATIEFFEKHNYFGYNKDYIKFFVQEMAPAVDYNGKILMDEKWKIALSPNGNGGWFSSLGKCGLLKQALDSGVQWLNVFAVDNVLQRIADPVFLGATIASNMPMGAKVIKKNAPDEKVGVICKKNGVPSIIEYYELTEEVNQILDENGERVYNYGVTLNYLFDINKLQNKSYDCLPVHLANKKISYIDDNGNYIKPTENNGYKFETLILDMIQLYDDVLIYEVERNKEFAPIKNKEGIDSLESARELLKLNGVEL